MSKRKSQRKGQSSHLSIRASKHWKNEGFFFQALELFDPTLPSIGKICVQSAVANPLRQGLPLLPVTAFASSSLGEPFASLTIEPLVSLVPFVWPFLICGAVVFVLQ